LRFKVARKKRNWKEFERFTARIEAALAPQGAVLKCPDHIADIDTGKPRQIDATLRFPALASRALVCFECRDRDTKQDVRWIEELYGKQRSIGASLMVAVSAKPFYAPAVKKAETLGIELRIMTAKSAEDFANWLKTTGVAVEVREFSIADVAIELFSGVADPLDEATQGGQRLERPMLFEPAKNRMLSINQVVEILKQSGELKPPVTLQSGSEAKSTKRVFFQANQMQISAGGRMQDVRAMAINLLWTKKEEFVPFARTSNYASPHQIKVEAAEADVEGLTVGVYRDAATDEKHIRFDSQLPARVVSVTDEEVSTQHGISTRRRTFGIQVQRPKPEASYLYPAHDNAPGPIPRRNKAKSAQRANKQTPRKRLTGADVELAAVCENKACRTAFPANFGLGGNIGAHFDLQTHYSGPCPRCGGRGVVPAGEYVITDTAAAFTPKTDADLEVFERARALLRAALASDMTPEQFQKEAADKIPELASTWKKFPLTPEGFLKVATFLLLLWNAFKPQSQTQMMPKELMDSQPPKAEAKIDACDGMRKQRREKGKKLKQWKRDRRGVSQ
jgi:hypothetical protein